VKLFNLSSQSIRGLVAGVAIVDLEFCFQQHSSQLSRVHIDIAVGGLLSKGRYTREEGIKTFLQLIGTSGTALGRAFHY
jgi:hypothetical protein